MKRRTIVSLLGLGTLGVAAGWASGGPRAGAQAAEMTVYKNPSCGCCGAWVEHVEAAGFTAVVRDVADVDRLKAELGVPEDLYSCHTAVIDGYVVEGHVPAVDVRRLLVERPAARGLAVPGMPIGSPGMEQGATREPYAVILFGTSGEPSVFARH